MATAQQIKSLLESYSDADGEMFVSVALQIAAHEARAGKGKLASEIKRLVDDIKTKQKQAKLGGSVPITRPAGELAALLSATYPRTKLSEMVLSQHNVSLWNLCCTNTVSKPNCRNTDCPRDASCYSSARRVSARR